MNLRNINLNLLPILNTLLETQNVSKAANALGMTQSAVSHALNNLRAQFDDELFIRTPQGMTPTAFAQNLKPEIDTLLKKIEGTLEKRSSFTPRESTKKFTIGISEYAAHTLLPSLQKTLSKTAPNIKIIATNVNRYHGLEQLEKENIDCIIGNFETPEKTFNVRTLYHERFECIAHKKHPLMTAKSLTLKMYEKARHLKISLHSERESYLDEKLAKMQIHRDVCFILSDYMLGLTMAANSNCILTEPEVMSRPWLTKLGLKSRTLPFDINPVPIKMVWHRRFEKDPAHIWLRQNMQKIAKQLD